MFWGVKSTLLKPLFPGSLKLEIVVPIRVTSMRQVDLLENYLYSIKY